MKRFNQILILLIATLIVSQAAFAIENYDKEYYKNQINSHNLPYNNIGFVNCIYEGKTQLVEAYIKSGMDPNGKFFGFPLTFYALEKNQTEVLKIMLKSGASPNTTCMSESLLHRAINKKLSDIAKLLIENGADINGNEKKISPLSYAIKKKQTKIVEYLLNAGAKIDESAIKYAKKSKDEYIKNLVLSKLE